MFLSCMLRRHTLHVHASQAHTMTDDPLRESEPGLDAQGQLALLAALHPCLPDDALLQPTAHGPTAASTSGASHTVVQETAGSDGGTPPTATDSTAPAGTPPPPASLPTTDTGLQGLALASVSTAAAPTTCVKDASSAAAADAR